MNIEHLSKHLIQEHIYNNLSSLCRFLFVASMRRSVWEARKAAAKCFLWKPCSVVRKYSTPGNVRHICLHPTLFSHFWDFSSTSRFLCWPLLCLFAQMLFPSSMSPLMQMWSYWSQSIPAIWARHVTSPALAMMWAPFDVELSPPSTTSLPSFT